MGIEVKVVDMKIVVTADIPEGELLVSKSGKSLIVASTGGFMKTGVLIGGRELSIGMNAVIPNKD